MDVMIVGAGYVGLSMGAVLSSKHNVVLIDINKEVVDSINAGKSPIHEEGIKDLLQPAIDDGNLRACNTVSEVGKIDIILVCVGTPSNEDGSVNLSFVEDVVNNLIEHLTNLVDDYAVIALKSTVPPGTTRHLLLERISELPVSKHVAIAFNPEFLREGTAIQDALNPDRIVIGTEDERAFQTLQSMYVEIVGERSVFVKTGIESAELCKYAANSFLATKISFANEWANLCEKIQGADIDEVMNAVSLDHRISANFFGAGVGYGGSCFPKDVQGAIRFAEKFDVNFPILAATHEMNASRPLHILSLLNQEVSDLQDKKIAILGLTFKPGTDDTRDSPALRVLELLRQKNACVCVHDPLASRIELEQQRTSAVTLTDNVETCTKDADACILLTDWGIYKELGLKKLTESMNNKVFIDGRRVFANEKIPEDIIYRTVGSHI